MQVCAYMFTVRTLHVHNESSLFPLLISQNTCSTQRTLDISTGNAISRFFNSNVYDKLFEALLICINYLACQIVSISLIPRLQLRAWVQDYG